MILSNICFGVVYFWCLVEYTLRSNKEFSIFWIDATYNRRSSVPLHTHVHLSTDIRGKSFDDCLCEIYRIYSTIITTEKYVVLQMGYVSVFRFC